MSPLAPAFATFAGEPSAPLLAAAIHHGHDVRPEVAARLAVSDAVRLREEDPATGAFTGVAPVRVVVHRSRFEVDLNRPRDAAVYLRPHDAWGLSVWDGDRPPPADLVARSLDLYDRWYRRLTAALDDLVARHGAFVVFDVHSYNHRRDGPDAPPADPAANPEVNVGTGSLDRDTWGPVVDAFMGSLAGAGLDVRENVRFRGGHLSRWVHGRYPHRGCALALEFKKTWIDEWTGEVDERARTRLMDALAATVDPTLAALGR